MPGGCWRRCPPRTRWGRAGAGGRGTGGPLGGRPMSSPAWCMWYAASSGASWCALHQARSRPRTSASASSRSSGEGSNHFSPLRASGVGKSGSPCGPWHAACPKSSTFWCRTFKWLISPQSMPKGRSGVEGGGGVSQGRRTWCAAPAAPLSASASRPRWSHSCLRRASSVGGIFFYCDGVV